MLVRLIYTSTSAIDIAPDFINSIREKSIANNTRNNITGILTFNRKYFLQCLEGNPPVINDLYRNILLDKRHTKIQLISYSEVSYRYFPSWSMAFADIRKARRELYYKFSDSSDFEPYKYSGEAALTLLSEIPTIESEKHVVSP